LEFGKTGSRKSKRAVTGGLNRQTIAKDGATMKDDSLGNETLTSREAYLAMFDFLERLYELTKWDDIGAILGSMRLLADGRPADNAYADDWKDSVARILAQRSE
jgi:hypothetical protein